MKKFMAFVFLIPACGFLTNMQSGSGWGKQSAAAALDKTAGLDKEAVMARAASLAVPFVRNAGRFKEEVRYSADLFSGRFFLTDKELVYSLVQRSKKMSARPGKGVAFKEFFINEKGGRISFKPVGEEKGTTKISYFRGNDPAKWQSGLASYNSISLGDIYPGIQVKLRASGKNVEKIFYVSPRSDVARIRIGVSGVAGLKIADDGRLLFKNSLGELAMRAPVAWQEIAGRRHDVKVGYRLLGNQCYGFAGFSDFDKRYALVIDPALDTLIASTFLGGGEADSAFSLALDRSGNIFLTGSTSSADFPATPGAYDRKFNSGSGKYPADVFVSKLNGNLTELLASTYLGGGERDIGKSLVLDSAGNVYLTGGTFSTDFPTTPGSYDRVYNGGTFPENEYFPDWYGDAFISKLDGNLTTLLASTYLGGSDYDLGNSLAIDRMANVYLTGSTGSTDFPTTPGAYDRSFNSLKTHYPWDIFVSKLNSNLTILLASTFLGGSDYNRGNSLVLDRKNNVYLTGSTCSINFPTTPGAYDRTYNGGVYSYDGDAYVSRLDGNLTTLLASTYLGGSYDYDIGNSLALDSSGNVFLTGETASEDFPTTPGAYNRKFTGGAPDFPGDAFISKLDDDLSVLLSSTFLKACGGMDPYSYPYYIHKCGKALILDRADNVFVTGDHAGECFYEQLYYWAFVSKLDKNLTTLLGQKCIGETCSYYASGSSLALDTKGNVYFAGHTSSEDFPTTIGAYDRAFDEGEAFVSKLNGNLYVPITLTVASPNGGESWVAGTVHDITWASTGKIADVRIELSTDNGAIWSEVSVSPARYRTYPWTVPNTPSRKCLVRISDADNATVNDIGDAVFSILMNIDLAAERREVRAFSIVRQYGRIQFLIGNSSVPVAKYRIMRRKGSEDFALLKEITPSQLQNNQFQMHDKYLEKGTTYTYRVEAYDAAGQLIGISSEKTI